jgi:stage II sporulation protein D
MLFATSLLAQQPDVQVRLFSLYRLNSITISPVSDSTVRLCKTCAAQPLHEAISLRSTNDKVALEGKLASRIELSGDLRFELPDQRSEIIRTPVEITSSSGQLVAITRMRVEDYVAAVVQGETAADMPPEALKAVAVTARTYTAQNRGRHGALDFCDSTHCQHLHAETAPATRAAVEQTRGETLWIAGVHAPAYYHKDCGGHPESASVVWPRQANATAAATSDPYCVRVAQPWRAEISRKDIIHALTSAGIRLPPAWNRIAVVTRTASGRAATLLFTSGNSVSGVQVPASTLRFALGRTVGWQSLKSDLYEVSASGELFTFKGRGVGHGVGLCQTGAAEMAREGKSYRDILSFYFPGALTGRAAQGIPWKTHRASSFDVQTVTAGDERVIAAADAALRWAQSRTGLSPRERPVVAVFPNIQMYRDSTGEPGWVAASTRNNVIQLQPLVRLGAKLPDTLRHEFVHLLLETNASSSTPLWFREGLAIYLARETPPSVPDMSLEPSQIDDAIRSRRSAVEMRQAYAAAAARVRRLAEIYGRDEPLRWLRSGLPPYVLHARGGAGAR